MTQGWLAAAFLILAMAASPLLVDTPAQQRITIAGGQRCPWNIQIQKQQQQQQAARQYQEQLRQQQFLAQERQRQQYEQMKRQQALKARPAQIAPARNAPAPVIRQGPPQVVRIDQPPLIRKNVQMIVREQVIQPPRVGGGAGPGRRIAPVVVRNVQKIENRVAIPQPPRQAVIPGPRVVQQPPRQAAIQGPRNAGPVPVRAAPKLAPRAADPVPIRAAVKLPPRGTERVPIRGGMNVTMNMNCVKCHNQMNQNKPPIGQGPGLNPIGGHPVGGHPVGGHPVGGHPVGGHPIGGFPAVGHPIGGRPVQGVMPNPLGGQPGPRPNVPIAGIQKPVNPWQPQNPVAVFQPGMKPIAGPRVQLPIGVAPNVRPLAPLARVNPPVPFMAPLAPKALPPWFNPLNQPGPLVKQPSSKGGSQSQTLDFLTAMTRERTPVSSQQPPTLASAMKAKTSSQPLFNPVGKKAAEKQSSTGSNDREQGTLTDEPGSRLVATSDDSALARPSAPALPRTILMLTPSPVQSDAEPERIVRGQDTVPAKPPTAVTDLSRPAVPGNRSQLLLPF